MGTHMITDVSKTEILLEYTFSDKSLAVRALTHPSYLHEVGGNGGGDYQRLEFLGDAVLGLLLAEMLYQRYPDWDEGLLSQLRSRLAGQDTLADRARALGVGQHILLGRGEMQAAGGEKDSILSDVLEALIAALYLDGGIDASRSLVLRLFSDLAAAPETLVLGRDSKSELQEYISANGCSSVEYRLLEESGPPHDRLFVFQLVIGGKMVSVGRGKSKKAAQQAAAAEALVMLSAVGHSA